MHRKQITDEIWINVFKLIWVNSEFFLASNLLKEKILVDVFDVFKGNKNINKLLSILQQENYDQLTEFLNYDDHLVLTLSHFLTADIWQAFDRWYAFNKPEAINTRAQKIKAIDKPRLEKTTITQPSQQSSSRNNDPELQKKKTDIIKFLWVNAELFKHPLSKELLDPKHPLHMLIKVFYTGFAQSKQKFAYFQAALPYLINGDFEKMGRVLDNNLNLVDVLYNYLSTQSKSEMDKSLKQWFVEYTKVDYYVNINRNKRMDRLRNTISEEATLKITQEQIKAAKEQDENARQVIKQAMRILTSNLEFFQASMVQGNATLFSSWVKKNEEREAIINEFSRKIATELWVSAASKQYKTKAFTDALKNLLNNPTLMESFLMMNMSLVTIICDLDTNKYDSLGVSMKACIETWYDEHSEEKRKKSQRDNRMIESPQKLNIKPLSENNQNLFTPAVKKLFATNQNIQTQGADFKNNL